MTRWIRAVARVGAMVLAVFCVADCASYKAALRGDSDCQDKMNNCVEGCDPLLNQSALAPGAYGYAENTGGCEPSPYNTCVQRCFEMCE